MLFGTLGLVAIDVLLTLAALGGARRNHVDLQGLTAQVKIMSTAIDNLKAAVAAQISVDQSAVTLIQGIAEKLKQPDADVQALADELSAASAPLAAAVSANTPVATPAPAAPAASAGGATTA